MAFPRGLLSSFYPVAILPTYSKSVKSKRSSYYSTVHHTFRLDMSSAEAGEGVSAANKGSWTTFIKVSSPYLALVLATRRLINSQLQVFGFILR
jgi:hypothetical protein